MNTFLHASAPLWIHVAVFLACGCVIVFAGTKLTALADRLADRTGMGEAMVGAVLLGASTSLAGITTSVTAAWDGHPVLSLSNALGGIAAQTVFLVIADLCHRRVNLEHAAASLTNMMQGALLIVVLGALVAAMLGPNITLGHIHPLTLMLPAGYLLGMRMIHRARRWPMWRPQMTRQTRVDTPDVDAGTRVSIRRLWVRFAITAGLTVIAGWILTRAAIHIAARTPLSETLVGGLFTAVTTSLPELVTSIAAVRRGALTLAVSGVIGGNAFDTLFVAAADIAYRPGSIYHEATSREMFLLSLTIVMTGVLLMGLLRREKRGPANIGFESLLVLALYLLGMAALAAPS